MCWEKLKLQVVGVFVKEVRMPDVSRNHFFATIFLGCVFSLGELSAFLSQGFILSLFIVTSNTPNTIQTFMYSFMLHSIYASINRKKNLHTIIWNLHMFIHWNFETWLLLAKMAWVLEFFRLNLPTPQIDIEPRRTVPKPGEIHWTSDLLEEMLEMIVDGNKIV